MSEEKTLTVDIYRSFEPYAVRNYYVQDGDGYRVLTSTEIEEPPPGDINLFDMEHKEFAVVVRNGDYNGSILYGEDELREFLDAYFNVGGRGQRRTSRASKDYVFFKIALAVAERSTCRRRAVGAVAVDPRTARQLATGYNGAPSGASHCLDIGCLRDRLRIPSGERSEMCRAVHAEENVLAQAALHGVKLEGSHVYCTHKPCVTCLKNLRNAGVRKVLYLYDYPWPRDMMELIKEIDIELVHVDPKELGLDEE